MIPLLERLIEERSEYTYWLSQKYTGDEARIKTESHEHYIKVLEETKTILAERMEPEVGVEIHTESSHTKLTNKPSQTNNDTPRKRKLSSTALHASDLKKAAKTEAPTPAPPPVSSKGAKPAAATEKPQQVDWRRTVAKTCNGTTANKWATAKKPMSYAAAARAIAA